MLGFVVLPRTSLGTRRGQLLNAGRIPAQPVRMLGGLVEVRRGFKQLVLPSHRYFFGLRQQWRELLAIHGLESFRRLKCLVKDFGLIDACDYDRRRQTQRVVETLDRRYDFAL